MAAIPLNPDKAAQIIADWRTGEYSQQDLADKHKVSKGKVNQLCKGVEQDMTAIVTAGVQYRQGLAEQDDRIVTAVTEVVDERTKHIQFFTNASLKNVSVMMKKIGAESSISEHRQAQTALKDAKEVVLGKEPDTAIQINNNTQPRTRADFYSTE